MTDNDMRLAVISASNTLASNNPKGLTEALKANGYPVDPRYDIMSYDALSRALIEVYSSDPKKWATIMKSVPFNYEKTDSSTTQNTRTLFENISRTIDPSYSPSTGKLKLPTWFGDALAFIAGSTTTTNAGPAPIVPKAPVWAYVGLSVVAVAIIVITWLALRQKSI